MFGKWHLGDNYPYRPFDRGFDKVVAHKGGGVGQTPDFWGNSYFDDTYFHNGETVAHEGYCTDIWFDETMRFIEERRDEPFFAYIGTNAPHSPYLVAKKYLQPYVGNPEIPEPAFYGMIANIDENFGKLRVKLRKLGIEDNTILIFMTDNGSSGGCDLDRDQFVTRGYNAGMRGKKASYYDGGTRVPFFIRWPKGKIGGGRDIGEMCLHVDMLPTFIDLCGLAAPDGVKFDGRSFASLLRGEIEQFPDDRIHFVQYRQGTEAPEKWTNTVMTRRWRLVYGKELYDIKADPGQKRDIAAEHPDVVARLRAAHEEWWTEVEPQFLDLCPIVLGNDAENPTCLDAMDVMGDVAWNQGHIAMAQKSTGRWTVEVERAGRYRFSLRRWPEELGLPIDQPISRGEACQLAPFAPIDKCRAIQAVRAQVKLFDLEKVVKVEVGQVEAVVEMEVGRTGKTELEAWFDAADGESQGAYYVYVERVRALKAPYAP
ncbi:arylsulfatase, partial [bacterium]|nr:arylsulfatase [bacterium]